VDRARHRASRGTQALSLTRKEFGILELLLAADGRVVSAEELLEHVWDAHLDPFSNIVSVTVARLRRKLGEPPLIDTVVGKEYRLAPPARRSRARVLSWCSSPGASLWSMSCSCSAAAVAPAPPLYAAGGCGNVSVPPQSLTHGGRHSCPRLPRHWPVRAVKLFRSHWCEGGRDDRCGGIGRGRDRCPADGVA
jgi:hypothetical protein